MAAAPPPGLVQSDFDAIEAAVMETQRGRWFLAEYARRNRMADTRMILDAMARLEHAVSTPRALPAADPGHDQLATTAAQIAERLQDIGWDLRERGFSEDICAAVDRQAAAVSGLAGRLEGVHDAAVSAPLATRPARDSEAPPVALDALRALDALPLARKLELFV